MLSIEGRNDIIRSSIASSPFKTKYDHYMKENSKIIKFAEQ